MQEKQSEFVFSGALKHYKINKTSIGPRFPFSSIAFSQAPRPTLAQECWV